MADFIKINAFVKILLVLLLSAPSQCALEEPPGEACNIKTIRRGNCSVYNYQFVPAFDRCLMKTEIQLGWEDLEYYCRGYGGHLVKITSKEENDAINRDFTCGVNKVPCRPRYEWIGLHKTGTDFRWISDNSNWTEGVDFGKIFPTSEQNKCYLRAPWRWTNLPCSTPGSGICMEDYDSFPKTPVIKSDKPIPNITTVTVGETKSITVECHAFVGVKGRLEFMIENLIDGNMEPATIFGTLEQREDFRVDCTNKCSRFVQAKLTLNASRYLEDKRLVAWSGYIPYVYPCSGKDRLCVEITRFSFNAKPEGLMDSGAQKSTFFTVSIGVVTGVFIVAVTLIFIYMTVYRKKKSPGAKPATVASEHENEAEGAATVAADTYPQIQFKKNRSKGEESASSL